jgi:hypothetical protein
MANPNLLSITSVVGNTAVANVTTVNTTLVENAAASNTIVKINSMLVSSIASVTETVNIGINRSSTSYFITSNVSVSPGATLDVLNKSIYLIEGDSIFVAASANTSLHAICSYEVIG